MSAELSTDVRQASGLDSLVFDAQKMQAVATFGDMMSQSKVTVPAHLRGNPADCAAIVMQAMGWGMNPFAVAQKTHVTQGGALGYEAQLVNAVVINSHRVKGVPDYEFLGDWSKILGKVTENKSERGGKYYTAAWAKDDEAGLGVIVRATLVGETEPRELTVMMSQAYPRFSTQWATDPQQQITYLAVRKWARRFAPDVILGVSTTDEIGGETIDMGLVDEVVPPKAGPQRKAKPPGAEPTGEVSAPPPPPPAPTPAATASATAAAPAPAAEKAKATAAPAPAAKSGAGLEAGKVAYLRGKLKAAGVDEATVLTRYGVPGLEGLSVEQFDEMKSELLQVV